MDFIDKITKKIVKVLKDEGLYSPILDQSIEDYAQISHLKAIAFEDATTGFNESAQNAEQKNDGKRSVVFELSREGDRRYKINPAYTVFIDLVRESQKILDGLCMTARSANMAQGDELDELKTKIKEAGNG